jgi:hypothetical protein
VLEAKHPWRGEVRATLGGLTWQDLVAARPGSASVGWERRLAGGAHALVRGEREGAEDKGRESKRKAYSREYNKGWAF